VSAPHWYKAAPPTRTNHRLASLATLFYEPLWLFMRKPPKNPLKPLEPGMRISLGAAGSGTYKLARELIVASGADLSRMKLYELGENDADDALMRGELDFVAMSMSPRSPIIQKLLKDSNIVTLDWPRADAHVALMPYLSKRTLPRGVADLASDRPARDLNLIATKANLIVRADLHQAIQHLLLEAASEIHGGPGIFNKSGEFPAAEPIDLSLSDIAREYYRSGQPFLQRYLPFWLAALTSRLLVLLIPIVGVVYPLFRLVPAIYGWSMRRRIFRLYGELKFLEAQFPTGNPGERTILFEHLDDLEARANRIRVPIAFSHMLYTLKHHISLVQQRTNEEPGQADTGPAAST
jgi:NMT1 family protein